MHETIAELLERCFLCDQRRGLIRGPRKGLIKSVITYACPTWEYAADANFLKLQRLQNRVLRAFGNLDRSTPVRELRVKLKLTP
jgi:hypothetical protein